MFNKLRSFLSRSKVEKTHPVPTRGSTEGTWMTPSGVTHGVSAVYGFGGAGGEFHGGIEPN